MSLKFCSFASGSSGNCYLVKTEETALLIDAGISGKKIFEGLKDTDTPFDMVEALLITHEHIDHVKSIPIVTKKLPNVLAYANGATWNAVERPVKDEKMRTFITGEDFAIGDMTVHSFPIPHDAADPVGYSIYHDGRQVSVVTDLGYVTEEIYEEIASADLLVLEANHEKEILLMGRYPYSLKRRILGDEGHLSNVSAGECICRLVNTLRKKRRILLGHLSRENNDPAVALLTVKNTLMEQNIITGGDIQIEIAERDRCSDIYRV